MSTLGAWSKYLNSYLLDKVGVTEYRRLKRYRPPRVFGKFDGPMLVYDHKDHVDVELLSRIQEGQYVQEGYVWHVDLKKSLILVLTNQRLLVVGGGLTNYCQVVWSCLYSQIIHVAIGGKIIKQHSPVSVKLYYTVSAAKQ